MPVKDDDIAPEAPPTYAQREGGAVRAPATRAPVARAPEEARSGVRDRRAAETTPAELDLGPQYALRAPMGETAYGQAYRAEHVGGRREVAVHLLLIDDERDARDLPLAFAKCAQLSHPHVIALEAYGRAQPDGPYYLVTQALEGTSLAALLDDEGTFDLLRALRLVRQIAQALRAAHKLHLVHGALSPANVRLVSGERSEDVRVVGFGCTAFRPPPPTATGAGRISRPPRPYEPPELASGAQPDARADVFALGSLLFRMLTGKVPVLRDGEPPPSLLANTAQPVPRELDTLVAGCLAADPNARIDDTVVLIGKLREIVDSERGSEGLDGLSGESPLPPERDFLPEEPAPSTGAQGARDDPDEHSMDDADDHSMMGGNRTSMVWIAAGLLLALFALWLLWEANARS